jgi:hypothetical protein
MREFFRGWRRKVGIVALVMACAVGGMWCRSFLVDDSFGWGDSAPDLPIWFTSNDGMLIMIAEIPIGWGTFRPSLSMWDTEESKPWNEFLPPDMKWSFQWCGFGYGWAEFQFVTFPYWSIVIPLALLSAYLLLWKARKPTIK